MRLINADALRDRLQNLATIEGNQGIRTYWSNAYEECADMVDEQPTIIEFDNEITNVVVRGEEYHKKPKWILCSDRLPNKTVLCCDNRGEMIIGMPYKDEESNTEFSAESDTEYMIDCVAWMLLPKPYGGVNNEVD